MLVCPTTFEFRSAISQRTSCWWQTYSAGSKPHNISFRLLANVSFIDYSREFKLLCYVELFRFIFSSSAIFQIERIERGSNKS